MIDRDTWLLCYKVGYMMAWRRSHDDEYANRLAMAYVESRAATKERLAGMGRVPST